MTIASVNYEVVTDSWWCALAASAMLFGMLGRLVAGSGVESRSADGHIVDGHIIDGRIVDRPGT
jgi:hypothetical protein